jgi:ligand-binding sensor domain-containing protein
MQKLITFLLILSCTFCFAQPSTLYFRNLNTGNGLSQNKINCIIQDKRGFTWIGTDDGLNRYDGHRFQVFRHDPSNSATLSGNMITDLLEDKNEILWIATADGGLSRYDYRLPPDKQFQQFKHSPSDSTSIPVNIINALLEDASGDLWLATSGNGVLRFNKEKKTFSEPIRRKSRTCLDLAIDHKGIIWAGKQGGGLTKIDPATMKYEEDERYFDVYAKLPHMTVSSLFRDSKNNMWMGSWDKVVYRVDPATQREDVFRKTEDPFSFPEDDPLSFAEDKNEHIWIGGKYNGLYFYHPATGKFFNYRHDPSKEGSLAGNQVNCIFIDGSGIVWLGTNGGISIYDPVQQKFAQTFLPIIDNNRQTIYDFHTDENNNVLIGTSEGLYVRNATDRSLRHFPLTYKNEKLAVTKFFRNRDGVLYIGTQVSVFRLNKDFSVAPLPNTDKDVVMNHIIESRVVSMTADTIDGHPVLLVSPYGHYLAYYDFVLQQWVSRQDSIRQIIKKFNIRDNLIREFFKTSNGNIWMATTKSGLGEWARHSSPVVRYYNNIPAMIQASATITYSTSGKTKKAIYGSALTAVACTTLMWIQNSFSISPLLTTWQKACRLMIAGMSG